MSTGSPVLNQRVRVRGRLAGSRVAVGRPTTNLTAVCEFHLREAQMCQGPRCHAHRTRLDPGWCSLRWRGGFSTLTRWFGRNNCSMWPTRRLASVRVSPTRGRPVVARNTGADQARRDDTPRLGMSSTSIPLEPPTSPWRHRKNLGFDPGCVRPCLNEPRATVAASISNLRRETLTERSLEIAPDRNKSKASRFLGRVTEIRGRICEA
jgi:hypothetical protein